MLALLFPETTIINSDRMLRILVKMAASTENAY
jgi:hypothetical protein